MSQLLKVFKVRNAAGTDQNSGTFLEDRARVFANPIGGLFNYS